MSLKRSPCVTHVAEHNGLNYVFKKTGKRTYRSLVSQEELASNAKRVRQLPIMDVDEFREMFSTQTNGEMYFTPTYADVLRASRISINYRGYRKCLDCKAVSEVVEESLENIDWSDRPFY